MARFETDGSIDPILRVSLEPGETICAERNAMVAMDRSLSLKGATRGGFFKSLARKVLNDETFFQQVVEAGDRPGEILLAPNLPGDVTLLDVGDPSTTCRTAPFSPRPPGWSSRRRRRASGARFWATRAASSS